MKTLQGFCWFLATLLVGCYAVAEVGMISDVKQYKAQTDENILSSNNLRSVASLPSAFKLSSDITTSKIENSSSYLPENPNDVTAFVDSVDANENSPRFNISLLSVDSKGSVIGVNVAGVGLHSGEILKGINISALAIGSERDIAGLNVATIIINANDHLSGLSIAGQSIGAGKKLSGVAIAGMHLRVGDQYSPEECELSGVAISAFNEINGANNGVSIGIINKSLGGSGVQLGILNYNGGNPWWSRVMPVINVDFSRFKTVKFEPRVIALGE